MTRTIPAGLATHIAGETTSLATGIKIKRIDGTILGFTDADKDKAIDISDGDGSITYEASTAYTRSAVSDKSMLNVDNLSIEGILDSNKITDSDIRAGRYDRAEVITFMFNYENIADGIVVLRKGWLGEIKTKDHMYISEIRGLTQAYSQVIGEITTPDCRADLGDIRCKVKLDPDEWLPLTEYGVRQSGDENNGELILGGSPTVFTIVKPSVQNKFHYKCTVAGITSSGEPTFPAVDGSTVVDGTVTWQAIKARSQQGTVGTVIDRQTFEADAAIDIETGWWNDGLITWLTGNNVNLKHDVKDDDSGGSPSTLKLFLPAPFAIQVGDTFKISTGCDKIHIGDCSLEFDNIKNFRGEPFLPGTDVQFNYPNAR